VSEDGFRGRVAIVTGASSGIGYATALELSRRGATVVAAARNEDRLRFLEREVLAANGEVLAVPADVASESSVEELVGRTVERFGGIDILVNNAGVGLSGRVEELRQKDLRYVFDVNVFGAVSCIQRALPHLRPGGNIVNVSSVVGKRSVPKVGGYSATKFALNALTDALRVELAGREIAVTSVYPGTTRTEFSDNSLRTGDTKKGWRPKGVPSEKVARRIARAIERRERDAYVSFHDRVFVALVTLAPGLADRGLRSWVGS
jgi:NAD(P)-dependent dehydrogenase (short-subunit alcohol dehydrogenase family)